MIFKGVKNTKTKKPHTVAMPLQGFEGVVVDVEGDALRRVWSPDGTMGHFRGAYGAETLFKTVQPDGTERFYHGGPGEETVYKTIYHHLGRVVYANGKRVWHCTWRSAKRIHTFY
jgi:hypothetical protein